MPVNYILGAVEDYVQVSASLLGLVDDYIGLHSLEAPELRSELEQLGRLQRVPISTWWRILERVAVLDPEPALGLRIGLLARPHHVGVLGYLAMACVNLEEAIRYYQRFHPLLQNLTPLAVSLENGGLRLTWDKTFGNSTQYSTDVMVAITLAFARQFTERPELTFSAVTFPARVPQDQHDTYRQLLNCPLTFGGDCLSLLISPLALTLPIKSHNAYMHNLMESQAQTLVSLLPHPDVLMAQIIRVITEALESGESTTHQICERIGFSPDFILRCLKRRNLTLKAVVNKIRRQRCLEFLGESAMPLSEITYRLGYSEQSAFTRAFRSWYGVTPSRYRQGLLSGISIANRGEGPDFMKE